MKYTYMDSTTFQSAPEDMGCWKLSWPTAGPSETFVTSHYPKLPCVINGDTMTMQEAKQIAGMHQSAKMSSTKPTPRGWVFSPLEIENWTW